MEEENDFDIAVSLEAELGYELGGQEYELIEAFSVTLTVPKSVANLALKTDGVEAKELLADRVRERIAVGQDDSKITIRTNDPEPRELLEHDVVKGASYLRDEAKFLEGLAEFVPEDVSLVTLRITSVSLA